MADQSVPDTWIFRPSARPLHAVLHRDVGALQLLRDARVPHPLHDGAGRRAAGSGFDRRARRVDLRHSTPEARGRPRSSAASIADRFLGQHRTVLSAASSSPLGHFTLAFNALPAFYTGLALIVFGTGLPEAATSARSSARSTRRATSRRDAGFSIFYMGINLGAFFGPLISGYLAQKVNWHIGFACAGVGMTLGLIQYVLGRRCACKHGHRRGSVSNRAAPTADTSGARSATAAQRAAASARERMEANRRHRHLLHRSGSVLGRVRAGRIDAEPVRGSLHAHRRLRLQLSIVVVPVGAAALRHHSRARVRVAVAAPRAKRRAVRARRSSRSACCSWACRSRS